MSRLDRRKSQTPLWLLSYADMGTLVLCFMVLLTSLSVIDERLKMDVLGSVNKNYSSSLAIPLPDNPDASELAKLQEGLGEKRIFGKDFNLLKQQVLSEELGDMIFQENRHIQIISLNETALFEPGTTTLSDKGRTALDRIMPLLVNIQYPLLVAGHASPRMDEEGPVYSIDDDVEDPSWKIGFERAFAVHAYLVEAGVPSEKVSLESFGQYRPRVSMRTPLGRTSNRRVDLVLDKRNIGIAESIKKTRKTTKEEKNTHEIDGFQFDLTLPGEEEGSAVGGEDVSFEDVSFRRAPYQNMALWKSAPRNVFSYGTLRRDILFQSVFSNDTAVGEMLLSGKGVMARPLADGASPDVVFSGQGFTNGVLGGFVFEAPLDSLLPGGQTFWSLVVRQGNRWGGENNRLAAQILIQGRAQTIVETENPAVSQAKTQGVIRVAGWAIAKIAGQLGSRINVPLNGQITIHTVMQGTNHTGGWHA